MKERPILFSTPMVQAILAGRKTMTRRIMRDQPGKQLFPCSTGKWYWAEDPKDLKAKYYKCPYGEVGDILWVRETWCDYNDGYAEEHKHMRSETPWYLYRASCHEFENAKIWRPSIFMPRAASRISLKITDIRVERIQEISEQDAIAEGVVAQESAQWKPLDSEQPFRDYNYRDAFELLWYKINGPESWKENPFVWIISFTKL